MAWAAGSARRIKPSACAIIGIHGVNLGFTHRQSRMGRCQSPIATGNQAADSPPLPPETDPDPIHALPCV